MNSHSAPRKWYRLGSVDVEIFEGVIATGSEQKRLEPRLAGVLALLVQRGAAPVTRDEFLDTVWDEDGSDEALTQSISRLRQLLGNRDLIRTLPRIGYQLAEAPQILTAAPDLDAGQSKPAMIAIPKTYLYGLASGAALVIIAVALTLVLSGPGDNPADTVELEIERGPEVEFHRIPDDG